MSKFNPNEGTLFVEINTDLQSRVIGGTLFQLVSSAGSNECVRVLWFGNTTTLRLEVRNQSGTQAYTTSFSGLSGETLKIAINYGTASSLGAVNGTLATTHVDYAPINVTGINIGQRIGTNRSTLETKDFKYFPRALSNAELIALTTL